MAILNYRLPARMRELHTFVELAPELNPLSNSLISKGSVKIVTPSKEFVLSDYRFLLHPLADGAVLMSRVLLNFLRIGLKDRKLSLQVNYKPDDIKPADVGLFPISVSTATSGWSKVTTTHAEDLLTLCLATANKVSGHLTRAALGLPKVHFTSGGVHGCIM
jgi:hypothetical protein